MRIFALDPATQCGWAFADASAIISGTWDLSTRRDESSGMKLIRLRSKLEEMGALDLLVFEAARNAMPKMQGALVHQAELQAVIKVWCHDHRIDFRGYSPAEIKKFATGKGNAGKADVIAAVRSRFGFTGSSTDEADAIALLHLALSEYGMRATA